MKAVIGGMLLLATLAAGSAFGYVQDSDWRWERRAEIRERNHERVMAARERARYRHDALLEASRARAGSHRLRHEMARERHDLLREEGRQRREMTREMRREYRRDFGRVY
jgi:hypothetical protein